MVEKFKAENSTQVDLLRLVFEIPTYNEYGPYYMVSPFNKVCVFLDPFFDMVNGIWADFYHLMLDSVSDLDTR